jgi:hypothetical protein
VRSVDVKGIAQIGGDNEDIGVIDVVDRRASNG